MSRRGKHINPQPSLQLARSQNFCRGAIQKRNDDDEDDEAYQQMVADSQFVGVDLPNKLKKVQARAEMDPEFARRLLFDYFDFAGADADRESERAGNNTAPR